MKITKRNGTTVEFDSDKLVKAVHAAFRDAGKQFDKKCAAAAMKDIREYWELYNELDVETVQDIVVNAISSCGYPDVAKTYDNYRSHRAKIRKFAQEKMEFIKNYIGAYNTADATVDDNSNVANKNIAVMNVEIHKEDNIEVNREMVMNSLEEMFPDFDRKQYLKDLNDHIIYKHDESTFMGAVAPYCASVSMYPFLLNGIAELGRLSASPKNLDSFCGIYINMVFAISRQFAGAVATPEFFVCMDWFCRKMWGDNYIEKIDKLATNPEVSERNLTIRQQIRQCFQQVVYSINQPSGGRESQSAFVNFSYFDKAFFESMFGNFVFPDGTRPIWETLRWLQFEFMEWFAAEREKVIITFPVESFAFVYKDGKFEDKESARDLAKIMAKGHCPFIYISDTVDSLSSCCFKGDEFIKIYNENDNETVLTIEEFVKNYSKDTKYFIDSYNTQGENCGKVEIVNVLEKDNEYNILYEFTVENKTIHVTPDHPMLVKDIRDNQIKTIPAEYLYKDIQNYEIAVE